jgi:ribosomal protein L6P/L9E
MGAGTSSTKSLAETINTTLNEIVTNSSNSIKNTTSSRQLMRVTCTKEQAKIAADLLAARTESYHKALESYYKYGSKGNPPKEPEQTLCVLSGASQNSNVTLKSDTKSKQILLNNIEKELNNTVSNLTKEKLEDPIIGFSSTDVEVINKVKNNIKNKTYINNLNEVITAALVEQEITIDGAAAKNVSQTATVSLITESLFDSLTENIDKTLLYNSSETKAEIEKTSGQSNAIKSITELIGNIFTSFFGTIGIFLIIFFLLIYTFPKLFCFIPGMSLFISCFSKKNTTKISNNTIEAMGDSIIIQHK